MAETSIILNVLYNFKKLKNMKLRNLLYATMIACAFASCSNDDDPIDNAGGGDGPQLGENEAALVVNMAGVQTKAAVSVTKENDINSATTQVVVFNGTGDNAKVEKVGLVNEAGSKTNKVTVTPGDKMVVVLANYKTKVQADITYSALKASVIDFANFEGQEGYLTMNSAVYTVTLLPSKTNYLGYVAPEEVPATENYLSDTKGKPVYLYHNVAKVVLSNVAVDKSTVETQYPNPRLDVKEVFILHAHKNSKLFTEAAWGETGITDDYLNSLGTVEGYSDWVTRVEGKDVVFDYLTTNYVQDGYNAKTYTKLALGWESGIKDGKIGSGDAIETTWGDDNKTAFYTYENMNITSGKIYTLLVVKGDFSYDGYKDGVPTRIENKGRYYSAAVGITGMGKGYGIPSNVAGLDATLRTSNGEDGKYLGVIRNLQYNVAMTVKGPGYDTPFGPKNGDDTFLAVNAKVVEFGAVGQDVDFE